MANVMPKEAKLEITDKWNTEVLYVALFQSTSNCTTDGISTYATFTNECSGTNYTAGGKLFQSASALSGQDAILSAIANTQWAACTLAQPVKYAVVYVYSGTTIGKIRGVFDIGTAVTVTDGLLTIRWSASGLVKASSV